jgi:hypothetical protein
MIIEVYKSEEWKSITALVQGDTNMLEKDAVLIRTIEGTDWNDCMRQHHEQMGWEPYKPWTE